MGFAKPYPAVHRVGARIRIVPRCQRHRAHGFVSEDCGATRAKTAGKLGQLERRGLCVMNVTLIAFHHIGVGTTTFQATIEAYRKLGYEVITSVDDVALGVKVAFLFSRVSPWIEIVAPLGSDGPLKSFIERKVLPAPYHTCYATQDIEAARKWFKRLG